jgi:GT2 family glycosyltransferase/glycosyltransferase involved in cell wall biosynthesis/SAM-dependent methyltransferase
VVGAHDAHDRSGSLHPALAHRYGLAAGLATGRRCLDIACGEGGGTAWLAAAGATLVVGTDRDEVAVKAATSRHGASGARFAVADGADQPWAAGSFDLVTCLDGPAVSELDELDPLVAELERLAAPDAIVLLALPVVAPLGPPVAELEATLRLCFGNVAVLGQQVGSSSVVWPLAPGRDLPTTTLAGEPPVPATPALEPAVVVFACSSVDVALRLGTSHLVTAAADVPAAASVGAEPPPAGPQGWQAERRALEAELADAVSARLAAEERAARQLRIAASARSAAEERAARLLRELEVSELSRRAVEAELAVERGSVAGQVLRSYRVGVGRALPSGTRRRGAYDRTRTSVGKLAHRALDALPHGRDGGQHPAQVLLSPMTSPPLARAIRFPDEPDPLVSIVIRVRDHLDVTLRCLARVASTTTSVPYEVVVVDDASDPDTAATLAEVTNLRIVTNPVEEGYLAATNRGVATTSTELVVLLNHDTEVHPGWLDALVDTARDDRVGAVGARLLDPSGRLSEAGRVIFSDGSYTAYGEGANPNSYRYLSVREVDYCSAACLLVRRSLWDRVGGLDPVYRPAHYGDADLCFSLRSLGASVVYQPRAVVTQHAGIRTLADAAVVEGMARHQARNQSIFADRWRDALADQAAPGQAFRGRRHRAGPTVVVVDHHVPAPDHDSGSVRMDHLLRLLTESGRHVCFIPQDATVHPEHVGRLQQLGIEVAAPCLDVEDLLRDLEGETELVVLSRPEVAVEYLPIVRRLMPHAVVAYDTVDLHDLRARRRVAVEGRTDRHDQHLVELERRLSRTADIVIAVSDPEAIALHAIAPHTPVVRISNVHDDRFIDEPFERRSGFLFIGNFQHPPNVDAVSHLLESVWPAIRNRLPDATLHLVGAGMHPSAVAGSGGTADGVVVHGWLPDLEPVLGRARVFLAPLRYGAGVKGKIGQALASGVPVVTTSVGAEGMVGSHLVVADDPGALVDAAVALHEDPARWNAQVTAGRAFITEALGVEAAARSVEALLDEAGRIREARRG